MNICTCFIYGGKINQQAYTVNTYGAQTYATKTNNTKTR